MACRPLGRLLVMAILLFASLTLKRMERYQHHGLILYAFFTESVALCLDYYLPTDRWLLEAFHLGIDTPMGIAMDKFDSSMIIIVTILLLTRRSGGNLALPI